jgi:hypothetical protein
MPLGSKLAINSIMNRFRLVFFAMLLILVTLLTVNTGVFAQDGGPNRKEVDLVLNKVYEVFIGNGGVFLDKSRHIGTLVVKAEEFNRPESWFIFTQRILDIQVYDKDGQEFETVYGLIRVYFNLDKVQYDRWIEPDNNMSIWYFDELNGGWHKCVTHWESTPGLPRGRLWCVVHHYTRYGLAWTKPTLVMKLEKANAALTASPTP